MRASASRFEFDILVGREALIEGDQGLSHVLPQRLDELSRTLGLIKQVEVVLTPRIKISG